MRNAARTLPFVFLTGLICATVVREKWSVKFADVAAKAGLATVNASGDVINKKYILEMNGSGLAFIDYNRDGLVDIFLVNGTQLGLAPGTPEPVSHLYRNNGDGTFTDVTREAGLSGSGWGQGACVADVDNDGYDDIFVTYYGKNRLYHNNGNGTFTEIAARAARRRGGGLCAGNTRPSRASARSRS